MKKYSVLIDLDRLKDLNTGLGQVALFFGEQLSKMEDERIEFTFLVPESFVGKFGKKVRYEAITSKRRFFPSLCPSYDLWYTIHQDSGFFPSNRGTPYILTINDLNFLGEKSHLNARNRLLRLQRKVNRAIAITTISRYSADEIRKHLRLRGKPVQVIYCGVTVPEFKNAVKPDYVPDGEILFSVGVVQPKKNYGVLFGLIQKLPEKYVLIIAGNKAGEYATELEKRIHDLGLNKRIILPGIISDQDKYWLFQHCKAVLFPSKFEGMGFPPVEAMRCGKPVFASTYSSIPEVSGDKAYYWENFDPDQMASFFLEKLKEHETDPGRPGELVKHSMRYTWENAANEYMNLFKKLLPEE
jgi:glycosyltransferase involved in cell wall biosynthesis